VWVAALAVFVLLEKFGPAGRLVTRVSGFAIAALGVYLAVIGA
jgi:predicted metal-binding membrane protein